MRKFINKDAFLRLPPCMSTKSKAAYCELSQSNLILKMRNSTLLIATITLIALSCSYEQVRAQACTFDSFGYTYTFDNFGHCSLAATPVSSQDTPILSVNTCQSSQSCSSDNVGVVEEFVIGSEIIPKVTLTGVDLGDLFRNMVFPSLQPKHTCVLAKDATPTQRTGFDECRTNLPDCDKMRWDVSGNGHRILTCICYRIFSSC